EVISGYTSWFLGVQSIVPNVKMDVKFTGSWYDEQKEADAARALINGGCVLLSQHADSMGAPSACELARVPNVSYNGSTASACPNTFIISSRINWQPYFSYLIKAAKDLREGKTATIDTDWMGTIDNNAVVLTECGQAAAEGTQAKLDEVKAKLLSGELKVFDTSKFTVTVNESKNANATVDENGHLTSYRADVNFDADYTPDTEVVANDEFQESKFRSAPYFDVQIDGITLLNSAF
ncbi:MAG: BMP family ABC transporter substrate-binding protein, partial [Candidatus Borkfalkiaceae bacterium]|nr:BMP family ABC transporter substrate-binding protein [Christensenellaceae bacterium]